MQEEHKPDKKGKGKKKVKIQRGRERLLLGIWEIFLPEMWKKKAEREIGFWWVGEEGE